MSEPDQSTVPELRAVPAEFLALLNVLLCESIPTDPEQHNADALLDGISEACALLSNYLDDPTYRIDRFTVIADTPAFGGDDADRWLVVDHAAGEPDCDGEVMSRGPYREARATAAALSADSGAAYDREQAAVADGSEF